MPSVVKVFDHFCKPLTELETATTPRGYVLNSFGRCDYSMSLSDPKVKEEYFQYGNLVHIEHIPSVDETGTVHGKLPDWTGIILPPRDWDEGIIHATAYSAEAILTFRAMPWLDHVEGTPKAMFLTLLRLANEASGNIIPIQPGVVEDKEGSFPDDLRQSAYDHIVKLVKDSGMDWNVTGEIDSQGNLQLFANLYVRRGEVTDLVLTSQNTELKSPLMTEQGTPANQVFGFSQDNTDRQRVRVEGRHEAALADYGPLQLNKTFTGKHDYAATLLAAKNLALARGRPIKLFSRTALDIGDTFNKLAPGNICALMENRVGFKPGGGFGVEAQVRMLSVDYNDLTVGKCPLNIEVL